MDPMLTLGGQRNQPIDLTADDDDGANTETEASPPKKEQQRADLIKQWNARKEPPKRVVPRTGTSNNDASSSRPHVESNANQRLPPASQLPQATTMTTTTTTPHPTHPRSFGSALPQPLQAPADAMGQRHSSTTHVTNPPQMGTFSTQVQKPPSNRSSIVPSTTHSPVPRPGAGPVILPSTTQTPVSRSEDGSTKSPPAANSAAPAPGSGSTVTPSATYLPISRPGSGSTNRPSATSSAGSGPRGGPTVSHSTGPSLVPRPGGGPTVPPSATSSVDSGARGGPTISQSTKPSLAPRPGGPPTISPQATHTPASRLGGGPTKPLSATPSAAPVPRGGPATSHPARPLSAQRPRDAPTIPPSATHSPVSRPGGGPTNAASAKSSAAHAPRSGLATSHPARPSLATRTGDAPSIPPSATQSPDSRPGGGSTMPHSATHTEHGRLRDGSVITPLAAQSPGYQPGAESAMTFAATHFTGTGPGVRSVVPASTTSSAASTPRSGSMVFNPNVDQAGWRTPNANGTPNGFVNGAPHGPVPRANNSAQSVPGQNGDLSNGNMQRTVSVGRPPKPSPRDRYQERVKASLDAHSTPVLRDSAPIPIDGRRNPASPQVTPTYTTFPVSSQGVKRAADGSTKPSWPTSDLRLREYQNGTPGSNASVVDSVPRRSSNLAPSIAPQDAQTTPGAQGKPHNVMPPQGAHTTARLIAAVGRQAPGGPFTPEEDRLIVRLKEVSFLTWSEIYKYFPNRPSWNSIQSHYSNKLKDRGAYKDPGPDHDAGISIGGLRRSRRAAEAGPPPSYYVKPPTDPLVEHLEGIREHPTLANVPQRQHRPEVSSPSLDAEASRCNHGLVLHRDASHRYDGSVSSEPRALGSSEHHRLDFPIRKLRTRFDTEYVRDVSAILSMTLTISRPPEADTTQSSSRQLALTRRTSEKKKRPSVVPHKPYLSYEERCFLQSETMNEQWDISRAGPWDDQMLHVGFASTEVDLLQQSIRTVTTRPLHNASSAELHRIATHAISQGPFLNRTLSSIESFLHDASRGRLDSVPMTARLKLQKTKTNRDQMLRRRELGRCLPGRDLQAMHLDSLESLGPALRFKGTSGDVNTLAWAPDGGAFAVGSAALTDQSSMQYNRPNNLLLGHPRDSKLQELPQHATQRPLGAGVNATSAMRASQDPLLFATISSVAFSADSRIMFTAGYDNVVRVWQMEKDGPQCRFRVPCQAPVEALAIGPPGWFAAAVRRVDQAIKIYRYTTEDGVLEQCNKFSKRSSPSASALPDALITPTSLRWGTGVQSPRYLLGGFSATDDDQRRGETCLWDLTANSLTATVSMNRQSVFDIAWSPSVFGRFAIGCSAGDNCNRGIKSVVRIYDSRGLPLESGQARKMNTNQYVTAELECPAWDMNDILINPYDENVVSAGCTDGAVYVWDLRKHDHLLHHFKHGEPLAELGDSSDREKVDLGVRFLSWDRFGRQLYTGSSDGAVVTWDPYRATEDAFKREVVKMDSGIMVGAFSPDYSQLLLGDVQGSVLTLAAGNDDISLQQCDEFDFVRASEADMAETIGRSGVPGQDIADISCQSGIGAAAELVRSGQIALRPLGDFPKRQAVQGVLYNGPFDQRPDAHDLRQAAAAFQARSAANVPKEPSRHASYTFNDEDVADSGAWKKRIPEQLPDISQLSLSDPGPTVRCLRCEGGRLSQIRSLQDEKDARMMQCPDCGGRWYADILGYTALNTGSRSRMRRALSAMQQSPLSNERSGQDGTLEESGTLPHYHDLWEIDRVVLASGRG